MNEWMNEFPKRRDPQREENLVAKFFVAALKHIQRLNEADKKKSIELRIYLIWSTVKFVICRCGYKDQKNWK